MRVKTGALETKTELRQRFFQQTPEFCSVLTIHAPADSGRKVIGPWKYPDVAVKPIQELDLHRVVRPGDKTNVVELS